MRIGNCRLIDLILQYPAGSCGIIVITIVATISVHNAEPRDRFRNKYKSRNTGKSDCEKKFKSYNPGYLLFYTFENIIMHKINAHYYLQSFAADKVTEFVLWPEDEGVRGACDSIL